MMSADKENMLYDDTSMYVPHIQLEYFSICFFLLSLVASLVSSGLAPPIYIGGYMQPKINIDYTNTTSNTNTANTTKQLLLLVPPQLLLQPILRKFSTKWRVGYVLISWYCSLQFHDFLITLLLLHLLIH